MITMKALLCDILLLFFTAVFFPGGAGGALQNPAPVNDGVKIEWQSVEDAAGYQVEVETNEGTQILSTRVAGNYYRYELAEGQYRVRVGAINRFDKVDVYSEWFRLSVVKALKPGITGLSIRETGARIKVTDVDLRGYNLMDGAKLFLRYGDVTIPAENCVYGGNEKIRFDLVIGDVPAGDYDLVVENPGGLESISRGMIHITEAHPYPGIFSSGIYIDAGYQYAQVAGRWSARYSGSFVGGAVVLGYSFSGIDFTGNIFFLRDAGLELQIDYSSFGSTHKAGIIDTKLSQLLMGGNVTYGKKLPHGFTLMLRAGGGAVYTSVREDRRYSASSDYSSTDAFLRAGTGILFMPVSFSGLQLRVDYCPVMYREYFFHGIRYGLFAGVRF